jgi:hypothetical protein
LLRIGDGSFIRAARPGNNYRKLRQRGNNRARQSAASAFSRL